MKHGSLFSGIGGFDLASEWMGWENVFHCEWNEFGQKILKYYWPQSISYGDITKTDFTPHAGAIDILTGGFPCQPFSLAGKRKGTADDRHLWPEMLRAIREIAPKYIVGENVYGLVNWDGGLVFDQVQADLENEGYQIAPVILPACALNAPHRRDRIWFVAYRENIRCGKSESIGREWEKYQQDNGSSVRGAFNEYGKSGPATHPERQRINGINGNDTGTEGENGQRENKFDSICKRQFATHTPPIGRQQPRNTWERGAGFENNNKWDAPHTPPIGMEGNGASGQQKPYAHDRKRVFERGGNGNWQHFPTQPPVCGRNDGLSPQLDGITLSKHRIESIKAYGNAIVPQVAYEIFKVIQEIENTKL